MTPRDAPAGELQLVEASYGWCPSRTLWTLGDDGYWHCHCCTTRRRYDELRAPTWINGQPR